MRLGVFRDYRASRLIERRLEHCWPRRLNQIRALPIPSPSKEPRTHHRTQAPGHHRRPSTRPPWYRFPLTTGIRSSRVVALRCADLAHLEARPGSCRGAGCQAAHFQRKARLLAAAPRGASGQKSGGAGTIARGQALVAGRLRCDGSQFGRLTCHFDTIYNDATRYDVYLAVAVERTPGRVNRTSRHADETSSNDRAHTRHLTRACSGATRALVK
jgi:hypothetical protein